MEKYIRGRVWVREEEKGIEKKNIE